MNIQYVPLEALHLAWERIAPFLKTALDYSKGDYTIEQAKVYLSGGEWQAVVAVDETNEIQGAAAIQFFNRPNARVAYVIALGGKMVTTPENYAQFKAFCASRGATVIEAAARDSAARLWARLGFEEKYRVVGATL